MRKINNMKLTLGIIEIAVNSQHFVWVSSSSIDQIHAIQNVPNLV